MRQTARLHVTMSAREVVAFRRPFVQRRGDFSDAGVALDEVLSLRASQEPLVLRVEAVGGGRADRDSVRGDWLCDSDGSEPRRIPPAVWSFGGGALEWSARREWLDAWEHCEDASWLLLAASCGSMMTDRRVTVAAALGCVSEAAPLLPDVAFVRRAMNAVGAWCRGGPPIGVAQQAEFADAMDELDREAAGGYGFAHRSGSMAAAARRSLRSLVNAAVNAGRYPTDVYCDDLGSAAESAAAAAPGSDLASVVRSHVPTVAVLREAVDSAGYG